MMKSFSRVLGLLGLLLGSAAAPAQQTAGYGDWQLHLPTAHPLRLADAGNRLYVVAEAAFYVLDKNLNTTQVLSSRDGLHDVGAALAAYDSVRQQTVVVYRNSNIDVIQANGQVRNVADVLRKTVQGGRRVYDLTLAGRRGYLATSFGLVVLDLDKLEVRDTYASIGPNGTDVEVFAAAVSHDTLFAATAQGLQWGRLRDNLLDYRSWNRLAPQPGNPGGARHLATYHNHVYAAVSQRGVFVFQPSTNTWRQVVGGYADSYQRLRTTPAGVLVAAVGSGVARVQDTPGGAYPEVLAPAAPGDQIQDFVRNADGSYYVANYGTGLQKVTPGPPVARETYQANGPQTSLAFGLLADARSNTVNVFTGGYSSGYVANGRQQGFYEYGAGQWTNYTREAFPAPADYPNLADQVRGARAADGTLYVGTFRDGLLQWKGPGQFRQFTADGNTPFKTRDFVAGYVQVPDVAIAPDGKVWVVNYHKQQNASGIYAYDPAADTWTEEPYFNCADSQERLVVDDAGQVWVAAARKGCVNGITVLDPTHLNAPLAFPNLSTGSSEIYDLVKDQRGDIWVATGQGVAVLNDPASAFLGSSAFRAPIVRRGEGTGFAALFSDVVKCLAVDGGNRKWLGTDNGLWLFSPDADEALLHFTTANSPLPSNVIVDVAVNNRTGEVWVATDAGVVSYRGTASTTEGRPDCTQVSPNPVRPDFGGLVGIAGVANNAQVKITDVAGQLVYATTANGGTVTWNLNDANGQRVKSGMYLVLTSDADGGNTCVSKVAVLSK